MMLLLAEPILQLLITTHTHFVNQLLPLMVNLSTTRFTAKGPRIGELQQLKSQRHTAFGPL